MISIFQTVPSLSYGTDEDLSFMKGHFTYTSYWDMTTETTNNAAFLKRGRILRSSVLVSAL